MDKSDRQKQEEERKRGGMTVSHEFSLPLLCGEGIYMY